MSNRLQTLPAEQAAGTIAYTVWRNGLVDGLLLRNDLNGWRNSNPNADFGSYLLERSRLQPDELSAVTAIAEVHLAREPESVEEFTTAWLDGDDEFPDTVFAADTLHESNVPADQRAHAALVKTSDSSETKTGQNESNRFRILSAHRSGGLGEVFLAEDTQFHRQVALKRIKPKYLDKTKLCDRFLVEAELTGGLEHPGIVPVYGLGKTAEGTPFYAMKFVKGKSLGDALAEFHARPDKSFDSVEFRKLLRRFATVCYTIHFSHSRGVLHRDIKPDNLMLGDFDETLVVDWGIAKVIGKKESGTGNAASSASLYPVSRNKSDATQLGKVIGSPGFMSGEQALGWHDSLGPESDVFSLGATLYAMLIGSRPFTGSSPDEILQNTIAGSYDPPRKVNSRVPKPLEAICVKAMQSSKSNRYPAALKMAEDIEQYLSNEPVSAWKEPSLVRIRRWMNKHGTAVMTGLAGLLLLTVGAIVASTLLASANSRAMAEGRRATANFGIARGVVDDILIQLAEDPRLESASLENLTQELLVKAESLQRQLESQSGQGTSFDIDRARTSRLIAGVAMKIGENDKAIGYLERARDLLTPHLKDDSQVNEVLVQVMGDYATALARTGRLDDCLAAYDRALELTDERIGSEGETPASLATRIFQLSQKEIALRNQKKLTELAETRGQYWLNVEKFFAQQEQATREDLLDISRNVLGRPSLSEQEKVERHELILECIARLENSLNVSARFAADGNRPADNAVTLAVRVEKANDMMTLAGAYAATGDKKKSYEVGFDAARQWYELAGDNPNVTSFRKFQLWSLYNALMIRAEFGFVAAGNGQDAIPELEVGEIRDHYRQASEMFRTFEENDAIKDVEAETVYTHLICQLAQSLVYRKQSPELADEIFERCLEVQQRFPDEGYSNAALVRNEVYRTAAAHYMQTGRPEKATAIFDRQTLELKEVLRVSPDDFVTHRQLYDLNVISTVLLNAFDDNNAPTESMPAAIGKIRRTIDELSLIPEPVRKSNEQQVLGMHSRAVAMLSDYYEVSGDIEKRDETFDRGTDEILDRDLVITDAGAATWIIDLCELDTFAKTLAGDFESAIPTLDYLLEKVPLQAEEKVILLGRRATCHAELGNVRQTAADHRAAALLIGDVSEFAQTMFLSQTLLAARAIEARKDAEPSDQPTIEYLDRFATDLLLKKMKNGELESTTLRGILSNAPEMQRLRDEPELKELFELLDETGRSD